jgi:hypothetical protein
MVEGFFAGGVSWRAAARRAAVLRLTIVFVAVAFLAVALETVCFAADLPFAARVFAVFFRAAAARAGCVLRAAAVFPVAVRFLPACLPDVRLATNTSAEQSFTESAKD